MSGGLDNMAEFQKKVKDLKKALTRWGKFLLLLGATQLGGGCKEKVPESPKPKKEVVIPPKPVVKNAVSMSTYVVDSIDTPRNGTLLFCAGRTIVRYFIENNDSYRMRLYLFVHEQKHKDNFVKGLRSVKVSPGQFAKICMHDEISANIAALLTLRYEYLTADDKESVIKRYEKNEYAYYFRAIKEKKIFPEKKDKASRDAEYSFIMNKTRDMWMRRYAPVYQPSIMRMVERYTRYMDVNISSEKQNKYYQKGIKIAYDIGGIDFSKYMDKDIEPKDKNFSLLDQTVSLNIFKNNPAEHYKAIQKYLKVLYEENFPMTYEYVSQMYFAEGIKSALADISPEEIKKKPEIVSIYYNKIFNSFSKNKDFHTLIWGVANERPFFYEMMEKKDVAISEKFYEMIYNYKGLDLSKMIPSLPKEVSNHSKWDEMNKGIDFRDLAYINMLDFELEQMRKDSKKVSLQVGAADKKQDKSRKSEPQVIAIPDYTQPILVASTREDMLEIKKCIDDFYNIPHVMRHCNLKAQKKFMEEQDKNSKTMLRRQNQSLSRS